MTVRRALEQARAETLLELAQVTYMDEDPPYGFREDKAATIRPVLRRLLEATLAWASQRAVDRPARTVA